MSKGIQEEQQAVNSAQTFLKLEEARYETGIDPYVDVLIAQTTLLSDQLTLNNLQVQEMTAAVALIEALGGGWDRSQLPNPQQVTQKPASTDTSIQQ
jgi:outer membrane protein TolC